MKIFSVLPSCLQWQKMDFDGLWETGQDWDLLTSSSVPSSSPSFWQASPMVPVLSWKISLHFYCKFLLHFFYTFPLCCAFVPALMCLIVTSPSDMPVSHFLVSLSMSLFSRFSNWYTSMICTYWLCFCHACISTARWQLATSYVPSTIVLKPHIYNLAIVPLYHTVPVRPLHTSALCWQPPTFVHHCIYLWVHAPIHPALKLPGSAMMPNGQCCQSASSSWM